MVRLEELYKLRDNLLVLFLPLLLNAVLIAPLPNSRLLSPPLAFFPSTKASSFAASPPAQGEMLLLFSFPCLFKGNTAAPRICLWWGYPRTDLTASLNSFSGGHSTPESSHHFIWNQSLQVHRCQENYAHLHQHVTWPYLSVIFRSTVLPLGFTISEGSKPTF